MTFLFDLLRWLRLLVARLLPDGLRWRLLVWPYRRSYRQLQASITSPRDAERRSLREIIEANRVTEFGRAHAFDQVKDPATYAAKVPLRSYSELEPYIQRHRGGASDVLVSDTVLGYAISGGSRGCPKPIPVTEKSLGQWRWAEDLLERLAIRHRSMVAQGVCLHILPGYQEATSRTAMPMAPLPVLLHALGQHGSRIPPAVPYQLFSLGDESLRYYMVLRLAIGQPVTMLRAASPGTLTILAEHTELMGPRLLDDLAEGRVGPQEELPGPVRQLLQPLAPQPALATLLRQKAEKKGRLEPRDIWPRLQLLVCSTSGPSKTAAARLADRFGSLLIIDPGYRAAEGVFTCPWLEGTGGLPVTLGQFLEFLPLEEQRDATLLPSDLKPGARYRPVVTGTNGLYRYLMDDVVEVLQQSDQGPRLSLVGRFRQQLRLPAGILEEESLREAVTDACRSCDILLYGYTAWIVRSEQEGGSVAQGQGRESWWSRLLRRSRSTASPRPAPTLAVAVEPTGPTLAPDRAKKLVGALDGALRRHCAAYELLRQDGKLGKPCILVLKQGTFGQRRRQRLADGAAGGHASLPVLTGDGWLVDTEDVELQM